jgi:hypothetical protein
MSMLFFVMLVMVIAMAAAAAVAIIKMTDMIMTPFSQ